jgi:hypothetical protein
LVLKNEQIDKVAANSLIALENCHVRVIKRKMIIECDGHTNFTLLEQYGNDLVPEEISKLINLANDRGEINYDNKAKKRPKQASSFSQLN